MVQLNEIPDVWNNILQTELADLRSLHMILFKKQGKHDEGELREKIGTYAGFNCADDEEEKQKLLLDKQLQKRHKDVLLKFCDIFNLPYTTRHTKPTVKEMLITFIQSLRDTTEEQQEQAEKSTVEDEKQPELEPKGWLEIKSELQELRMRCESVKQEVMKTQQIYSEEINLFGTKMINVLVDAVQNYQTVLTENRKLHNEVQALKGAARRNNEGRVVREPMEPVQLLNLNDDFESFGLGDEDSEEYQQKPIVPSKVPKPPQRGVVFSSKLLQKGSQRLEPTTPFGPSLTKGVTRTASSVKKSNPGSSFT